MKKYLCITTILALVLLLIIIKVVAFDIQDVFPIKVTADSREEVDRLFHDMGIVKIPHNVKPLEFSLLDINEREVSISDFKGKIIFLNFWTTWCPSCLNEMASMEKLHKSFKDRGFVMVTINMREPAQRVRRFLKEHNLTFMTLLDSKGEVASRFGIRAIPTTFILDKEGKVLGGTLGAREWDSRKSIALFEHLIVNE
jgi:peroxiredoxin